MVMYAGIIEAQGAGAGSFQPFRTEPVGQSQQAPGGAEAVLGPVVQQFVHHFSGGWPDLGGLLATAVAGRGSSPGTLWGGR